MKKLLILGATNTELEIAKRIKELGHYAICTDNHYDWSQAPAKSFCDCAWNISWSDYSEIAKKCIDEKIDGIISGFSEKRVYAASIISKLISKHFYTEGSELEIIQNKNLFKQMCIDCNIRVPNSFNDLNDVIFPVIVKPADNGGSNGITICYSNEELYSAIDIAKTASITKEIVIEEYISADEVMVYFNVYNGVPILSAMCDRIMVKLSKNVTQLPIGYYFKSKYFNSFLEYNLEKYINLIKKMGIKNGLIAFQAFALGNDIIPFDPTFRLDGTMAYEATKLLNNVSSLDNLINYSLGDLDNSIANLECPVFKKYIFELPILLSKGRIKTIEGLELIANNKSIYYIYKNKRIGDVLSKDADFSQMLCRIQMCCNSIKELMDTIDFVFDNIKVEDENGANMIAFSDKGKHILRGMVE